MVPVLMVLVGFGGLCWILFALGYDLVGSLLDGGIVATFVYLLLGIADLYMATRFYRGYKRHRGITLPLTLMVLVILSGICWLLFAFRYDPITHVFGTGALAIIIYLIFGLASLYWVVLLATPGHRIKIGW